MIHCSALRPYHSASVSNVFLLEASKSSTLGPGGCSIISCCHDNKGFDFITAHEAQFPVTREGPRSG